MWIISKKVYGINYNNREIDYLQVYRINNLCFTIKGINYIYLALSVYVGLFVVIFFLN